MVNLKWVYRGLALIMGALFVINIVKIANLSENTPIALLWVTISTLLELLSLLFYSFYMAGC